MQYNFEKAIINPMTGKPFVKQINVDVKVKDAIIEALITPSPHEPITPVEKIVRAELADYLSKTKTPELNDEEIKLIRASVEKYSNISALSAVIQALDRADVPKTH